VSNHIIGPENSTNSPILVVGSEILYVHVAVRPLRDQIKLDNNIPPVAIGIIFLVFFPSKKTPPDPKVKDPTAVSARRRLVSSQATVSALSPEWLCDEQHPQPSCCRKMDVFFEAQKQPNIWDVHLPPAAPHRPIWLTDACIPYG